MRLALYAFAALTLLSISAAYQLNVSRDELIERYYSQVADKIPKSARLLLGDETINAYIGSSVIGMRTKNGELAELEMRALDRPTISITVDGATAQMMEGGEIGVLSALDSGGIRVKTSNWFSAFKVEALKKIYATSGMDGKITEKKTAGAPPEYFGVTNSFFARYI